MIAETIMLRAIADSMRPAQKRRCYRAAVFRHRLLVHSTMPPGRFRDLVEAAHTSYCDLVYRQGAFNETPHHERG